ncbi:PREDICTED: leucine-rich repeat and IQ domain-containing protein 1-like isoform X1 [Amphimedon queenslandica]|uniref:Uncharacterized protein n=1 Tax=Amphimedon queenslandica TaxID=400682 RepID=A0AAN0JFB4_AMPQE|nr:PREDICTED: leucine-rich repeat and IQ domain-containing protein 1-like isoform X1 [Amphimedon queenslandica]|eukprot:XP_019855472.1 PREDICTED: leucine-rich repeat and IQ domain-containing protein 1-like isoform X1 [Amphimedon queenslandica]
MELEVEDWVEEEIEKELEKISLEDLEGSEEEEDKENVKSNSNLRSEDFSPILSVQSLQRYVALRTSLTKGLQSELDLLIKEHDVSSNILLQSPPLSPPLSNTDVTTACNGVKQEAIEDVEINNKIKETEVKIRSLVEERRRLEIEEEEVRKNFLSMKEKEERSVILIQAYWRGYRVRSQLVLRKKHLETLRYSFCAALIQSAWRRFVLKQRKEAAEKKRREELESLAARRIQDYWKGHRRRALAQAILSIGRKEKARKVLEQMKRKEREATAAGKIFTCWKRHKQRRIAILVMSAGRREKERKEKERAAGAIILEQWRHWRRRQLAKGILEIGRREIERKLKEEQQKYNNTNKDEQRDLTNQSHDLINQSHAPNGHFINQSHDQKTQEELVHMAVFREIRSQEETYAQNSRERMNRIIVHEQEMESVVKTTRTSPDYKSRLEFASTPLSPHAWVGVVNERCHKWQEERKRLRIRKAPPTPFPPTLSSQPQATRSLSDVQLLATSPKGTKLDEVTVVHLYRLRGGASLDLTSLSRCPKLRILSIMKSPLIVFKDIGGREKNKDGCSLNIEELSLSSNRLEYIDFADLAELRFLDLSDNHLSSIHGLQTCKNLLELNLDENRIARIGGLEGCGLLQKLTINGNLIINSAGVASLPRLQHLSLSENHLPVVVGLEACPLLQFINLQQNNLQECVPFSNHVLLREIDISGNSLSDMTSIEGAWLPSLQTLKVSNNCISSISSLTCCIMLTTFDIRNNSLYNFPSFLQSIRGCYYLKHVLLDGNPITHEPKFKAHLLKALPQLQKLNDVELKQSKSFNIPKEILSNPLISLTLRQLTEQDELKQRHAHQIESVSPDSVPTSPDTLTQILDLKASHSSECHELLARHYKEHVQFNGRYSLSPPVDRTLIAKQISAAVLIQSQWRGQRERMRYVKTLKFIILIQSLMRGALTRRYLKQEQEKEERERRRREGAAVLIQSVYRGHKLRKKLKELLSSNSFFEKEEEVEIDDFLLSQVPLESEDLLRPFSPTEEDIDKLLKPSTPSPRKQQQHRQVSIPRFTLPGAVQEEVTLEEEEEGRKGVGLCRRGSGPRDGEGLNSSNRAKQQKIIDEWGFSSNVTAGLMLRRAGRHQKLKQVSHQRLRLQDPTERLNNFRKRNSQNSSFLLPYSERSSCYSEVTSPEKKQDQPDTTGYQWSHHKRVVHQELLVPPPPPIKMASPAATSLSSLPQMDLHILVGHTPRLVTSKAQNDLVRHSKSIQEAWDK